MKLETGNWKFAVLVFTLALMPTTFALAQAVKPGPGQMNGLEMRKGRELTQELARYTAEFASATKASQNQQAKATDTTNAKQQVAAQQSATLAAQRLASAQKAVTNAQNALTDWNAKVRTTHKAASTVPIDYTTGKIG
jgi:hypothetical protein